MREGTACYSRRYCAYPDIYGTVRVAYRHDTAIGARHAEEIATGIAKDARHCLPGYPAVLRCISGYYSEVGYVLSFAVLTAGGTCSSRAVRDCPRECPAGNASRRESPRAGNLSQFQGICSIAESPTCIGGGTYPRDCRAWRPGRIGCHDARPRSGFRTLRKESP